MSFRKKLIVIEVLGFLSLLTMSFVLIGKNNANREFSITVPLGGNAWSSAGGRHGGRITEHGISDWSDASVTFTAYVRVVKKGTMELGLHLEAPEGESVLAAGINGEEKRIRVSGAQMHDYEAGTWEIKDTGYVAIHIRGVSKSGRFFAAVESLKLSGSSINKNTAYVKNNEGNFFYWGRRGPSVHLNYLLPENMKAEWFYNEVTVPEGNDVIGSYFMADGFNGGYFGMQVNSATTRHVLFSVWSPYKTDNPNDIPDSLQIKLMAKGVEVHAGEFGNEGSGGQSYLDYPWKAGNTYKFLLHAQPDHRGNTTFTAYFYPPEEGKWMLIAGFKRPKTDTYLTRLYSFLENFNPRQGDKKRRGLFGNQWICTNDGQWIELNTVKFTTDNTGRKGYRMDYGGGVEGNQFFLQNCGFFSNYTGADSRFKRKGGGEKPEVEFDKL